MSYTDPFYKDPLFIQAQAARVEETLKQLSVSSRSKIYLLFSAHSIPLEMSEKSGYAEQLMEVAALVSRKLKIKNGGVGYQNRSGDPRDRWLEPDVKDVIGNLDKGEYQSVILVPAGFLSDHVEILYDLDVELKNKVEARGLNYFRASTAMDHPFFIELMGRLIMEKINGLKKRLNAVRLEQTKILKRILAEKEKRQMAKIKAGLKK